MALIPPALIFTEFIDFLASISASEEILAYQPSEQLQTRLDYLNEKNRADTLSPEEKLELQEFLRLSHFVGMLKVRVQKRLIESRRAS